MRPLATIWLVALCLLSASNCFNEASVTCLEGTFLEPGGTCVTCDASCATCDGPGNNDCTGCDDNEFRNEHDECRACEASCKSGEYQVATCPDPLFIQCGTCFGSCKACSGPNSDDCTECKEGAFLHATGKCVAFADSGQRLGNEDSNGVAVADLDGDGDLDAFIANSGDVKGKVDGVGAPNRVWLNDGVGNFSDSGQSLGSWNSENVALADLDGDGDIDAFVANGARMANGSPNQVWLNDGSGHFTNAGQLLGGAQSFAVALADLDGDGDIDAFVANGPDPDRVWLNDGAGTFTDPGHDLGDSNSQNVALADLDGDGDVDAFVATADANRVWFNEGGTFTVFRPVSQPNYWDSFGVALASLNPNDDDSVDAFVVNWRDPNAVWLNDGGGGTFTAPEPLVHPTLVEGECVTLADLDGDGDIDAFVGNEGESDVVWLNDGAGTFTDVGQELGASDSHAVALADFDGDGDIDVFVANDDDDNGENHNVVWLLSDAPP